MNRLTTAKFANPLWKRVAAAFFLLAFLGIHAVSISHQLHAELHHDAGESDHHCVFVQISNGQIIAQAAPASVPLPVVSESNACSTFAAFVLPLRDYVLLPGRAPPVSLA